MSSDVEAKPIKDVFIPKGTRVSIQGCPFYLAEDTKVQDSSEESQQIMNLVLAREKADMDSRAARRQARLNGTSYRSACGNHT